MSEVAELSIDPVSRQELADFKLIADTQFCELMGSESFNRKLTGIVPPGIYRGFDFAISGADKITICTGGGNTAAVERDGQMITVHGQHPIEVAIPRGVETAVVIEAISQHGLLTSQIDKNSEVLAAQIRVVPIADVAEHHLIVLTVSLPAVVALDAEHISVEQRTVGGLNNTPTFEQGAQIYQAKGDYLTPNNVQQSRLDKTQGQLLKVGAFGLGDYAVSTVITDLNNAELVTGFYGYGGDVVGNPLPGVAGVLMVAAFTPSSEIQCRQMLYTVVDERVMTRHRHNGVWQPWKEYAYVGAFGLGGYGVSLQVNNLDNENLTTGFYGYSGDVFGNPLAGVSGVLQVTAFTPSSGVQCRQTLYTVVDDRVMTRQRYGGVWRPWRTISHNGNMVGVVSQNEGIPAGAVFQKGSNQSGSFRITADGYVLMTAYLSTGTGGVGDWQFPIPVLSVLSTSIVADYSFAGVRDANVFGVQSNQLSFCVKDESGFIQGNVWISVEAKLF